MVNVKSTHATHAPKPNDSLQLALNVCRDVRTVNVPSISIKVINWDTHQRDSDQNICEGERSGKLSRQCRLVDFNLNHQKKINVLHFKMCFWLCWETIGLVAYKSLPLSAPIWYFNHITIHTCRLFLPNIFFVNIRHGSWIRPSENIKYQSVR